MADKTKIEWADATWNVLVGCSPVSAGCANCYAIHSMYRVGQLTKNLKYQELTVMQPNGVRGWTGVVNFIEGLLDKPLSWHKPRRIFVNSQSDLFHESVPFEWIDRIMSTIAATPRHTYMVLTKRPKRMKEYIERVGAMVKTVTDGGDLCEAGQTIFDLALATIAESHIPVWPLPNLWLGVSVENQTVADERVPLLLQTPAEIRFLSCEPLLGHVTLWEDVEGVLRGPGVVISGGMSQSTPHEAPEGYDDSYPGIDWVIVGGESGTGARPMNPLWARSLRDQCAITKTAFFFKQWGCWEFFTGLPKPLPLAQILDTPNERGEVVMDGGSQFCIMRHSDKFTAGRVLDGQIHDAFPEAS